MATTQGNPGAAQQPPPQDNPVEEGVLDTIQNLQDERIRRRERVTNSAWYRFLIIMLFIGGGATLLWIFYGGYLRGAATVVASPPTPSVTVQPGMTTATVKAALAETTAILDSADQIANKLRPAETPEPPSQSSEPKVVPQSRVQPPTEVEPPQQLLARPPAPRRRSSLDPPTTPPPQ